MKDSNSWRKHVRGEITALAEQVNNLAESIRELYQPLADSRDKVPQATNQLDRISQQTEDATNEVLDRIEAIARREEQILNEAATCGSAISDKRAGKAEQSLEQIKLMAGKNLDDVYTIMGTLQFQDITAQQMEYAAAILEDVESKLQTISSSIAAFDSSSPQDAGPSGESRNRKQRVYDPNAEYADRRQKQNDVDSLFEENGKKEETAG
jgi:chemotaxis regulatin CheY-phosphate phosphatase CheZ